MRILCRLLVFVLLFTMGCPSETETVTSIDGLEISATQCQDGQDNDGDGLTDCKDEDCQGYIFCFDAGLPSGDTDTDGGSDTDSDSDADSDSDSSNDTDQSVLDGLEVTATQCQDEKDNDNDGATDCEDEDCQGYIFCFDAGLPTDTDVDSDIEADGGAEECLGDYFFIENALDMILLRPYSCINGDIIVEDAGSDTFYLPNLKTLRGKLTIRDNELRKIDLPALRFIEEIDITESENTIQEINLESLITVKTRMRIYFTNILNLDSLKNIVEVGEIWVSLNDSLERIDLGALANANNIHINQDKLTDLNLGSLTEAGSLEVYGMTIQNFDMGSLKTVGSLNIAGLDISSLNLSSLQTATSLRIQRCEKLSNITMDALASESSSPMTIVIDKNIALTSFSFKAITGLKALLIEQNKSLESLEGLASLKSASQRVHIIDNPILPQCAACGLLEQLESTAVLDIDISGNKADTCKDNCVE